MNDNFSEASIAQRITKIVGNNRLEVEDLVVVERALTLNLNSEEFMTIICSPGQERELVTGILYSEGVISHADDILNFTLNSDEGVVWLDTRRKDTMGEKLFLKRYLTSCCGKGRTSFYFANDARLTRPVESTLCISTSQVSNYAVMLEEHSELFKLTGGVHGGALANEAEFRFYSFDIGRHNVLDKLLGQALLAEAVTADKVLVFSGRVSSEILIKTAKMRCPIIIARSAPTDLALQLAEELGITVIGFARENKMNIYTHAARIISS
ncbi:MAG: formate dehydrogenase accessory sulfurtransferase FdhD [Peptococcaceae bacterium]|nr:formate dehydrogenase accessory sulfurtransferase FdhD [Peptococcaceae bacterium]